MIPALNEAPNLPTVVNSVPTSALRALGWETEVIVVDNASTDDTAAVAAALGATVVSQPERGTATPTTPASARRRATS